MEYNFNNEAIRLQISKSTKVVPGIFTLALVISFKFVYLKKVGQDQEYNFRNQTIRW